MYYIYKHTCPNNKVYIGITSYEPKIRWANGFGYKNNLAFFRDIVKFGWDNIKHDILYSNITKEEALLIEENEILSHKSFSAQYGYNQTCAQSPAQSRPVAQYSFTGEYIRTFNSISEAAKTVHISVGSISHACKYHGVSKGYIWRYIDDDSPISIPADINKRIKTHYSYNKTINKPINKINVAQYTKSGDLIAVYNSLKEASTITGINQGDICSCCKGTKGHNGKFKYSAGGYVWKYYAV